MIKYTKLSKSLSFHELVIAFKSLFVSYQNIEKKIISGLKSYFDFRDVLLFGSGREALYYLLNEQCQHGYEVIIPAYGCPILKETILKAGMTPILVDLDKDSLTPGYSQIMEKTSPDTAAIIIVHEFGKAFSPHSIEKIRHSFSGIIIEDAAIAMSTCYDDVKKIGYYGDFTIFSGSIGKPHSCYAWGAATSKSTVFKRPIYEKTKHSLPSIIFSCMYLLICIPIIYNIIKNILNTMVKTDASAPPQNYHRPSHFDNTIMANKLMILAHYRNNLLQTGNQIIQLFESRGIKLFHSSSPYHTISRLPILLELSRASEFQEACKKVGIEVTKPYQYPFSTKCSNSDYLRENLYVITIQDDNEFVSTLESALKLYFD